MWRPLRGCPVPNAQVHCWSEVYLSPTVLLRYSIESVMDITSYELQKGKEIYLVKSKCTSTGELISIGSAQKYWQDQRQCSGHRRRLPATLLTQLLYPLLAKSEKGATATSRSCCNILVLVIVLIRRANFLYNKLYTCLLEVWRSIYFRHLCSGIIGSTLN